jgi:hypothetical protein
MRRNNDIDSRDVDDAQFTKEIRYISVDAVITTTSTATATIYRKSVIQNEVLTKGVLLFDESKGGVTYPIRFVHDRTITSALQLRPGDRIRIQTGRFISKHGRSDTEFHVKSFYVV